MGGDIQVGIHDQMPVEFDMLYGNELASNHSKLTDAFGDLLVATR